MPNEQMSTGFDQDALPPGNGVTDLPGPHPDPPVADHQDKRDTADEGEHEGVEDEVDERTRQPPGQAPTDPTDPAPHTAIEGRRAKLTCEMQANGLRARAPPTRRPRGGHRRPGNRCPRTRVRLGRREHDGRLGGDDPRHLPRC
jgi:hypothetical protein